MSVPRMPSPLPDGPGRVANAVDYADARPLVVDAIRLGYMLSMSVTTIRRMHAAGELPAPVWLTRNRAVWVVSEIEAWLATRQRADTPRSNSNGRKASAKAPKH
jgi:predicted DNA-binding transcriptional regulator AlpA